MLVYGLTQNSVQFFHAKYTELFSYCRDITQQLLKKKKKRKLQVWNSARSFE